MIGDLFKMTGSMLFARSVVAEIEDWYEYKRKPSPETWKKAVEISEKAQFMVGVGILLFLLGSWLSKNDKNG